MFKVLFFVMTLNAQGTPTGGALQSEPHEEKFQTIKECTDYALMMEPRIKDYMRGSVAATWEHPVAVKFKCDPVGDPA